MSTSVGTSSGDAQAIERAARVYAEAEVFMRDRVLSIVSHDLRGPLNAIHSWAHVLERKLNSGDPGVQRALEGIRKGVEQQVSLIENSVDAVRQASRELPLERRATPLAGLLDSVLQNARYTIGAGRDIAATCAATLTGATADIDAERVWQALWVTLAYAVDNSVAGTPIDMTSGVDAGQWRTTVVFTVQPAGAAAARHADYLTLRTATTAMGGDTGAAMPAVFRRRSMAPLRGSDGIDVALSLPARVAEAHRGGFSARRGDPADAAEAAVPASLSAAADSVELSFTVPASAP